MANNKSDNKKEQSLNTLKVAWISATASIVTAFLTSFLTYNIAFERLKLDNTIEKAEIFKELITKIENQEGSNYAILVLWKLYPDPKDRRLIVISALQNPQPQTISTLKALGFEKELTELRSTLLAILANTQNTEKRELISQLLLEADPEGVLELNVENILASPEISLTDEKFLNLLETIEQKPDLTRKLLQITTQDNSIDASPRASYLFAYALYLNRYTDLLDNILVNLENEPQQLSTISPLLLDSVVKGNSNRFELRDREKILRIAINYLDKTNKLENIEGEFDDILDIIYSLWPTVSKTDTEFIKNSTNILEANFKSLKNQRASTRYRIIRIIKEINKEKAQGIVLAALACEEKIKPFFYSTDAVEIVFPDLELNFEDFIQFARSNLSKYQQNCNLWRNN